jgi:hypothetical protein
MQFDAAISQTSSLFFLGLMSSIYLPQKANLVMKMIANGKY